MTPGQLVIELENYEHVFEAKESFKFSFGNLKKFVKKCNQKGKINSVRVIASFYIFTRSA